MASKFIKAEYRMCLNDYYYEFVCDTDADFASLPKCGTGSTAVSLESGKVKVVNASGEWVAFGG